jgi:hypothetical protein
VLVFVVGVFRVGGCGSVGVGVGLLGVMCFFGVGLLVVVGFGVLCCGVGGVWWLLVLLGGCGMGWLLVCVVGWLCVV